MLVFPAGVLTTRWISPFLMASVMLGRPSWTFRIGDAATPFDSRNFLVPSVATMENPSSAKRLADSKYGDRKLLEGLWYSDDSYHHNPNYDKEIDAILQRCGRLNQSSTP